jgi:hypothetical protein
MLKIIKLSRNLDRLSFYFKVAKTKFTNPTLSNIISEFYTVNSLNTSAQISIGPINVKKPPNVDPHSPNSKNHTQKSLLIKNLFSQTFYCVRYMIVGCTFVNQKIGLNFKLHSNHEKKYVSKRKKSTKSKTSLRQR